MAEERQGASASPSGSQASPEAAPHLRRSGVDPSRMPWRPIDQKPADADWIVYLPDGAEDGLGWALDPDERLAALLWWEETGPGRSEITHFCEPIAGPLPPAQGMEARQGRGEDSVEDDSPVGSADAPQSDAPLSPPIRMPEEIEKAIEDLIHEAMYEGGRHSRSDGKDVQAYRSALTAAILSRLGEAEAERDLWKRQYVLSVNRAFDAIEERDRAEASIGRVHAALDDACRMSAILLTAGEMTAQERRTARAVANGLAAKVRSALSEAPPQGDH